jgi:hypothetical protein
MARPTRFGSRRDGRPDFCAPWRAGIDAGILAGVKGQRKITVVVPDELVRRARRASGLGLAPTIRQGLELVAAREAYAGLRALRGKLKLELDLERLREDR